MAFHYVSAISALLRTQYRFIVTEPSLSCTPILPL